ncbi:MAG: pseudouridine synthase, partial [Microvirga sp.]|nr:pseudouridine synthase [Microvirga sp.]
QMLAKNGHILLDGAPFTAADSRIAIEPGLEDRLVVDGERLDPLPGVVLLMHKPLGVTCSHKEAGPLVHDLLPPRWRRREPALSTVGRLDKETSGLLLLTDDGAFLHKVIAPRSDVSKRYRAVLARPLRGDEGELFAAGTLMLDGETKPLLPASLDVLGEREAWLTVGEGRYHQVRRMFAAVGNHVEALHRDRLGGLDLPADLAPGAFRRLDATEKAAIFAG